MADLNSTEEPQLFPSKRKQTTEDDSTKKLRPDAAVSTDVEEKIANENGEKHEIEDEEEEDYEEEDKTDSGDSDDEDEHVNGGNEVDRKGKGIMKDDKGKGKMIEESEEDDDDDSESDGGGDSGSDGDDDFSDDPLTEVDLDNILPSRTRRRTAPSGVKISSDDVTNGKGDDA
ncbi:hypothetical protein HanRHA438_Chr07g0315621 [Helianthus annuus]|uniref:Histone chaperone domain CHZ n=1 Tax=Helianthus annuus TaxID=4232 RepID=A0A9K3IMH8_HELAN|nr:prothymosin alpha-A-like [Helianthus annuus]KAF5799616.1 hypothetical protein HanXRQr2_Chr07g0306501 [Helianthus annuus]KAJ0551031.1 hypothetical protein HanHA300_Chr07g0252531 [Helianthus annuus]KAJ0557954.1 hypothetical protein HanIR_Chr07g0330931 [Helianthus annuus]KAJ0563993.1 hypothetical protein HanHA89_Chr07g0269281 [Helianthus annuus]KAJ0729328.1 hypothetical protein HanLR1_Chr07g0251661 [Helianthus annuus]